MWDWFFWIFFACAYWKVLFQQKLNLTEQREKWKMIRGKLTLEILMFLKWILSVSFRSSKLPVQLCCESSPWELFSFTVRYVNQQLGRNVPQYSHVFFTDFTLFSLSPIPQTIVMFPLPSIYLCVARVWLREIGFSLTYGALMLKTWRWVKRRGKITISLIDELTFQGSWRNVFHFHNLLIVSCYTKYIRVA